MALDYDKFKAARKASGMTLEEASSVLSVNINTYRAREDDPTLFRIGEIDKLYASMNDIGKKVLMEAVDDIFLPA